MAGEMITSLKALLSPQMAKYVGSSCSQQLRGTGARGKLAGGGQPGLGPQAPGPALCPGLVGVGGPWRCPAQLDQQGCVPGLLASASPQPSPPALRSQERLCHVELESLTLSCHLPVAWAVPAPPQGGSWLPSRLSRRQPNPLRVREGVGRG